MRWRERWLSCFWGIELVVSCSLWLARRCSCLLWMSDTEAADGMAVRVQRGGDMGDARYGATGNKRETEGVTWS